VGITSIVAVMGATALSVFSLNTAVDVLLSIFWQANKPTMVAPQKRAARYIILLLFIIRLF
jgi:hypothetical protein